MNPLPSSWLEFLGRCFRGRFCRCWHHFLRSGISNRLLRNWRLGFRCRGGSSGNGSGTCNINSRSSNKSCCFKANSCGVGDWSTPGKSWFDLFVTAGYFRLKYRKFFFIIDDLNRIFLPLRARRPLQPVGGQ